jgi:DNA-directed RNA polymerase specialized sigma24 family protein
MRDLQVLKRDLTEEEQKLLGQLIQGLSLSEIADKLGISYTSAGVRLHRLRKKLRRSAGVF